MGWDFSLHLDNNGYLNVVGRLLNFSRHKQILDNLLRPGSGITSVMRKQIDLLYELAQAAILGSIMAAAVAAIILWPVTNHVYLSLWLSSILLVNLLRALLLYYQQKPAVENHLSLYLHSYIFLTTLLGLAWGTLGLFYSIELPIAYQLFIPLILSGLVASAISTTAVYFPVYLGFVIPVLLPITGIFLFTLPWPYTGIGYLLIVFAVFMLRLGLQIHAKYAETLTLQLQNHELLDTLKFSNDALVKEVYSRREIEANLRASKKLSLSAFDEAAIPMVLIDRQGHIIKVNKAVTELSGYTEEQMIGKWFNALSHPDDKKSSLALFNKLITGLHTHGKLKKRYITLKGDVIWANLSISVVRDEHNKPDYLIAQIVDITEAHELSEELYYQSQYDNLTGLINRREFEFRLAESLEAVEELAQHHALAYIDLDQFKIINDTCGHMAGDELLRQLATLFTCHTRKSDTLARLGGDEFGLLMEDCSMENAVIVANKIREAVEDFQFMHEKHIYTLGVSIGLIEINQKYSMTDLLKHVDAACYAAKDAGRNRVHLYHEHDNTLISRHGEMQWVSRITQAINNDDFILYGQAIRPISGDGKLTAHVEILIRMKNADGSIIPPGAFLPAAERYNLSTKLDRWVVSKLLKTIGTGSQLKVGVVAINLSGPSLCDEDFLTFLLNLILETKIDPARLCFEITETAAIANLTSATHFITSLHKIGCLFALDDFGSGLSSFAYLKNLPVDYLKIDGVFVRDIVTDPIDLAMVKSINEIGHVMGMKTIAEFVENDQILDALRVIGVDYAQGYGIGKPEPFILD